MSYKETLVKNYHGELNTFLGELHESEIFNIDLYKECCEAIRQAGQEAVDSPLDHEISFYVFFIYRWVIEHIMWHFNPADGYKIKNVTNEFLRERKDKLPIVVEDYFRGNAHIPNP